MVFSKRISTIRIIGLFGGGLAVLLFLAFLFLSVYWLIPPLAAIVFCLFWMAQIREDRVNADVDLWELMRWASERHNGFTTMDLFVEKGWSGDQIAAVMKKAVEFEWIEIDELVPGGLPVYRIMK